MVTIISKSSNGWWSWASTSKVKVSAVDTTEDYLSAKLVAWTDISLTASGAGNETLTVAFTWAAGSDEKVKYDAWDPTAGYVADKVVAWTGITVAEWTWGNENKLVITNTLDITGKVDKNTAITWATKTKITYDAKGLVTSGADATTADIADSLNKRYVTDAQSTVIGNTSWTNTWDQTITNSSDWTSHTVTLSASWGSIKLIEWANITLTTWGTSWAGEVTISGSAWWASDNSIAYIAM